MNDQTRNESQLDTLLDDRLRRHLTTTADRITIPERDASQARRVAHQRTIRRRRVVSGTVAAATIRVLVVGVQQLSSTGGERVRSSSTGADAPASAAAPAAAPDATTLDLQPAQAVAPAFVWKVVEPSQETSITSTFGSETLQSFPTLALSTAPGRSNDYDNIVPLVWRSEDGISWEQTDLESPFGGNMTFGTIASGGNLFALGTAPGIAATEPSPLQVAVAGFDTTQWSTVDLPVDTNDIGSLPYAQVSYGRSMFPLDDGGVLVGVTPTANVNLVELAEANESLRLDEVTNIGSDGVQIVGPGCPNSTVPTTTIVIPGAAPTATTAANDDPGCDATLLAWSDLGVPNETLQAMSNPVTEFFHITADGTVTPVESPAPGKRLESTVGSNFPVLTVVDGFGEYDHSTAYRYENGTWETTAVPLVNWMSAPGRSADATVGWGADNNGSQMYFARIGDDGSAVYSDAAPLFAEHTLVQPAATASAGGQFVSAVSVTHDAIQEAGGVELTRDKVTVRLDSAVFDFYFVDATTGERIEDSRVVRGENDMIVNDAAGDEIARFSWADIDGLASAHMPRSEDTTWSIATTADGVNFSVEPVADLLGLDPGDIQSISRMSSDGTQVVVTIALTDTYPDESRKQLVLVGTPLG
ncbi:MAG: hypothetical protein WBP59_03850 [Ilumatobacteraceae bacterium]